MTRLISKKILTRVVSLSTIFSFTIPTMAAGPGECAGIEREQDISAKSSKIEKFCNEVKSLSGSRKKVTKDGVAAEIFKRLNDICENCDKNEAREIFAKTGYMSLQNGRLVILNPKSFVKVVGGGKSFVRSMLAKVGYSNKQSKEITEEEMNAIKEKIDGLDQITLRKITMWENKDKFSSEETSPGDFGGMRIEKKKISFEEKRIPITWSLPESEILNELNAFFSGDLEVTKESFAKTLKEFNDSCCGQINPLEELSGDFMVVGDLHADLVALDYIIKLFFVELEKGFSVVFLGDYVDRGNDTPLGQRGIEVIYFLAKLKIQFPGRVFLLRGNHENFYYNLDFYKVAKENSFISEILKRVKPNGDDNFEYNLESTEGIEKLVADVGDYGVPIHHYFYKNLSYAAMLNEKVFCVHGGLPRVPLKVESQKEEFELGRLEDIKELPLDCFDMTSKDVVKRVFINTMLSSDPKQPAIDLRKTRGVEYTSEEVKKFLGEGRYIVRGHETVYPGFRISDEILTVFSSPSYIFLHNDCRYYKGTVGAVLLIDKYGNSVVHKFNYTGKRENEEVKIKPNIDI